MDALEKEIAILKTYHEVTEIEKQLQKINELLVTNYMFELSNGLRIYPVEVEAYSKKIEFDDNFVHANILQKNNYGKFYIHRVGKAGTEKSVYKTGTRKGIDICLSDSDDFYYGVLIRSIKSGPGSFVFGPNNVCEFIKDKNGETFEKLEEKVVLKMAVEECRDNSIILHSTRVGLGKKSGNSYGNLLLRTIAGLLYSSNVRYQYREKEKTFKNYIKSNNLSREDAEAMSLKILGYCAKRLINEMF